MPNSSALALFSLTGLLTGCFAAKAGPAAPEAPAAEAAAPAPEAPRTSARRNQAWWPEQVDLSPLRDNAVSGPNGQGFDYAAAFAKLDYKALKADIAAVLTDSQDWWPADYGTYGPLFIRMAWHSAGTYPPTGGGASDGGQIALSLSTAGPTTQPRQGAPPAAAREAEVREQHLLGGPHDLSGNVAGGGRLDPGCWRRVVDWEAVLFYWGPENTFGADQRYHGERELQNPLAAVQMGLIYVNPEGPNGNPDPMAAAYDIRDTFGRMAMNDVETVALIAGGHSFGKAHGAHAPGDCVDVEPAGTAVENQGIGWKNTCGTGKGADAVTSGLEGAWTQTPDKWSALYFANLMTVDWEQTKSPAGATQWKPVGDAFAGTVPDAHDPDKKHQPMMFTTDLSLKQDPEYAKISQRFQENPEEFAAEFAKAWFKLTHRDLGPKARYLGPEVPSASFSWQDPIPAVDFTVIGEDDASGLKEAILATGLSASDLVSAAWASASTFRGSDMRGGANGARVRLAPQAGWEANNPDTLKATLAKLEEVQAAFNDSAKDGKKVSLADVIVLGGAAGIEAASEGRAAVAVVPGRNDATAEMTDVVSFGHLEPKADGFRNYYTDGARLRASDELIDRADLLGLTPAEMTALVGGLRVLDTNSGGTQHGVFTDKPGTLSNDFFVNLLDMDTTWAPKGDGTFEGKAADGAVKWTATEVDLVFGSNSELRAISEVYAYDAARFEQAFVSAWTKVMQADRFDLHR